MVLYGQFVCLRAVSWSLYLPEMKICHLKSCIDTCFPGLPFFLACQIKIYFQVILTAHFLPKFCKIIQENLAITVISISFLALLHSEWPKLNRVLAVLSAIAFNSCQMKSYASKVITFLLEAMFIVALIFPENIKMMR